MIEQEQFERFCTLVDKLITSIQNNKNNGNKSNKQATTSL